MESQVSAFAANDSFVRCRIGVIGLESNRLYANCLTRTGTPRDLLFEWSTQNERLVTALVNARDQTPEGQLRGLVSETLTTQTTSRCTLRVRDRCSLSSLGDFEDSAARHVQP